MTPTVKLVYDFERKYNASGTGTRREILLVDVIGYINEAFSIWWSQMCDLYETNEYVKSELRYWENKQMELKESEKRNNYVSYFLPPNIYKRLNQKAQVSCEGCGEIKKIFSLQITSSDKINEVVNNPLLSADFSYEQLPANEGKNLLYLYPGKMTVEKVWIDYLEKPKELQAPSLVDPSCTVKEYINYSGTTITEDQNLISENRYSDRKIVDIAVMLAKGDRQDYQGYQKQIQNIIFAENSLKTN